MKKRSIVLLTLILALSTILAACGDKKEAGSTEGTATTKLAADQTFHINLASEPPTLDPAQSQDNVSSSIIRTLFEGLTNKDKDGNITPGVAEKWEPSADGKEYTFTLRSDAKWSNGDPVTAKDFEYAWKRVLDPKTQPAPPYAYQLYYIKNAQAYNEGKAKVEDVGVKAVDDKTLKVSLENATPYWLGLTSFTTYYPVNEKVVANAKWATSPDSLVGNGPFKLSTWTTGQTLEVSKNDKYWDNKNITLTKITASIVDSAATEVSSYKSGQLDLAGQPIGEIPTDQIASLKSEIPNELTIKGIASTYYYLFNVTEKPFNNLKIRQAFTKAINRQALIDNVTLGNQIPAFGLVPPGIKGIKDEFRKENPDSAYGKEDANEAKALLAEGLKEEGLDKLPKITLIYNTNDNHKKAALAIGDMWKQTLGAEVTVQNQEWGVFLQNRRNLNYQVARAGFGADYNDPMTFIDLFTSTSGNNDTGFKNAEYDKLVKEAYSNSDNNVRNEAMKKAEDLLIKQNQVILPIYYYTNIQLVKPYVKDVVIDYGGQLDVTHVKLLEH
ncbi:oligopeptide transport system substrate-binding protein [Paenibacillus shirakamiensis]|uniref:Oligopeptide transport system substrate-binding protein n=1 Tax=Paenibacillus shirakamiensis TaxID=1265935 RepID=A0ABS4JBV9_9BACL|nr:peptide ABC transporter substrate-binding protein [Paenibacillus shirakamiensis]MBP1999206.1 oligopeptide transport system substrate-binding protein [Paenibacillus shirakamiensis]